jgi:hypothetical protein
LSVAYQDTILAQCKAALLQEDFVFYLFSERTPDCNLVTMLVQGGFGISSYGGGKH